jgi:hypothetical protein
MSPGAVGIGVTVAVLVLFGLLGLVTLLVFIELTWGAVSFWQIVSFLTRPPDDCHSSAARSPIAGCLARLPRSKTETGMAGR